MNQFFQKKKNNKLFIGVLLVIILFQGFFIAKLYSEKDDKNYEVNLVQIKEQKDSLDLFSLENNLSQVDQTVQNLNNYLKSKNVPNLTIENLAKDSLANTVYLSNQTRRYSQYLVDLEKKLQQVPLGIPTNGYISSNFGMRINPIPPKKILLASIIPTKFEKTKSEFIEEKDSAGNIIKKTAIKPIATTTKKSNSATETDENGVPMQYHKGIDIAVPFGSDVFCAAVGKVIFAGAKGGYGNCVIVEHGNGLATLYGHLSQILVKTNQEVKVNDVLAKSGNTGRSTGPHLHYEVHRNNIPVNPKLFLNL